MSQSFVVSTCTCPKRVRLCVVHLGLTHHGSMGGLFLFLSFSARRPCLTNSGTMEAAHRRPEMTHFPPLDKYPGSLATPVCILVCYSLGVVITHWGLPSKDGERSGDGEKKLQVWPRWEKICSDALSKVLDRDINTWVNTGAGCPWHIFITGYVEYYIPRYSHMSYGAIPSAPSIPVTKD